MSTTYLYSLMFLVLISTISCNDYNKSSNSIELKKNEIQDSIPPLKTIENTNCELSKFLGKWISMDDPKSEIILQKNSYFEIYDNNIMDSLHFEIFENVIEKKCFLTTVSYSTSDTFKYEIINIDNANLTLMYLERGNELVFRRK
ncbi:MAG: hypothetical protein ACK567_04685 [Chitinophagales bacterium]|jgi:hypothetical protein